MKFIVLMCLPVAVLSFQNDALCGTQSRRFPTNVQTAGDKVQASRGIVGGDIAPEHSWPWQAFLVRAVGDSWSQCGGTVLSSKWILTAAHCVDDASGDVSDASYVEKMRAAMRIRLGAQHADGNALYDNVPIEENGNYEEPCLARRLVMHPDWPGLKQIRAGAAGSVHDVALIELDCTLRWTDAIRPACLPDQGDKFTTNGENVVLTGWGITGDKGLPSPQLKQLVAPVSEGMWGGMVFAVSPGNTGACSGDSGGPAHARRGGKWLLAGVAAFVTHACESEQGKTVYSHVPYYVDWISSTIG